MKRIRPVTYAEANEAKEFIEKHSKELEKNSYKEITKEKNEASEFEDFSSLIKIDVEKLPSQGKSYPKDVKIYYAPLTFGEVKFLSGSILDDDALQDFFLKKIKATFDKGELTYYDFMFIVVLIKMSTFGSEEYVYNWTCPKCKSKNKSHFNLNEFEFYDINQELPAIIQIEDNEYHFYPLTVNDKKFLSNNGYEKDEDARIACMIKNKDFNEAYDLVKTELNGIYVNVLESIDVMLYHGVKDMTFKCYAKKNKNEDKIDKKSNNKEVCGELFTVPFRFIFENVSTTDSIKTYLRDRIHFGI